MFVGAHGTDRDRALWELVRRVLEMKMNTLTDRKAGVVESSWRRAVSWQGAMI